MVIILETLWNLRNQVVHRECKFNVLSIIKNIESKMQEFAWAQEDEKMIVPTVDTIWICPPSGVVKFNVDAAFSNANATVVVVARNASGEVLNAWTKEYVCNDPLQS